MKTNFSVIQLQNPKFAESDKILKSCQHYGFCTSGCPTYVLLRDERDSPRGRIDLIKDMLEKGGAPDPKTVEHLDKCLSCGSCMTTCAVKVDYAHLIDHAREHIEQHYKRPFQERLLRSLIAFTVPRPAVFRLAVRLASVTRPLASILPRRFRPLFELSRTELPQSHALQSYYPAAGSRKYRVALLGGCAQQVLAPEINQATIRLLTQAGCDVVIPQSAGCCGSLALHMGRAGEAKRQARRNIESWSAEIDRENLDAILVNASGCGTTLKEYGHLFSDEADIASAAARVSQMAMDVTEWLVRLDLSALQAPAVSYSVVYHDPCSMRNVQKVTAPPRKLLRAAGYVVSDVPEGHFCCGSAGTYNMLKPDIARQLGDRKARNLESTGASLGATANIGCLTQIRQYTEMPMLHILQLLDWAYGGPLPPQLQGVELKKMERSAEADTYAVSLLGNDPRSEDSAAIW